MATKRSGGDGTMKPYYQDESVTIYNADCRDVLPMLPKVDLVLTDPPYGEVNQQLHSDDYGRVLDKGVADIETVPVEELAPLVLNVAKGSVYTWVGTEQVSEWRRFMVDAGMSTRLCIWEKTNPSPMNGQHIWLSSVEACVFGKRPQATFNAFCESPVWRETSVGETEHPTEKPRILFKKLILTSSNSGNTIIDPFMGSGTTLRAAKDLNRKAIGIELEERYCEIAANRMSQLAMQL